MISWTGQTKDIKTVVFKRNKWIAQPQVTRWSVMSCIYSIAWQHVVKVPLLQAGNVTLLPQMFKGKEKLIHKCGSIEIQ